MCQYILFDSTQKVHFVTKQGLETVATVAEWSSKSILGVPLLVRFPEFWVWVAFLSYISLNVTWNGDPAVMSLTVFHSFTGVSGTSI
jgi:hypothetical protein